MTAPPDRIEDAWFICKGGYFYRPDYCGYTTDPLAAGLYTEERARAEAAKEPDTMKALPAQRFAMAAHVRPGTLGHMLHTAAIAAAEARGREQGLRVLDLSKAVKHEHPAIQEDKAYLCKISGQWFFGRFVRVWFGWHFNGWHGVGLQFDAPGWNLSRWEVVMEIDPDALIPAPCRQR